MVATPPGVFRTYPLPSRFVAAFPHLEMRTAVLLHPYEGQPDPASSHGGAPVLWPDDSLWPKCDAHRTGLVPVLQVRAGDVPEPSFPAGLDVFQLLWCPRAHTEDGYGPRVEHRWWAGDDLRPLSPPVPPLGIEGEGFVPRPSLLAPERVVELPSAFALDDEEVEDLDDWLVAHWSDMAADGDLPPGRPRHPGYRHFSVAEGTKVGGHPAWAQYPEERTCRQCGGPTEYLLTVSSWEWDGESWWRWMPIDSEVRRMATERNESGGGMSWAEAGERDRHGLGLMIGDAGSSYVFICRACDRTYAMTQSS